MTIIEHQNQVTTASKMVGKEMSTCEQSQKSREQMATEAIRECLFSPRPCLHLHTQHLITNKEIYLKEVESLMRRGVVGDLSQATKSRILAALQMTSETKMVTKFLRYCDVVEITKASQMLDRPRQIRQLEKRIQDIEIKCPHLQEKKGTQKKKRRGKIDLYQSQLKEAKDLVNDSHTKEMECHKSHKHTAVTEIVQSCSMSGSFAKKVREWARKNLKQDFLEFVLLTGSTESWKTLADLVHFKPSDFVLSYFLPVVYKGAPSAAPEGSFVRGILDLQSLGQEELVPGFEKLAELHPQVYQSFNYLRTQDERILREKKICKLLFQHIPLGTAVWYLDDAEDLAGMSGELAGIVARRLKEEPGWVDDSSKVTESFGKLLERVLTFQNRGWDQVAHQLIPVAKRRLSALKEKWSGSTNEGNEKEGTDSEDELTVVIGDKSGSMRQAIQAATILATMISTCLDAELLFVDDQVWESPHSKPCSVEQVLEICQNVEAQGLTCLSAALWPFYETRQKIGRLVVVSDENDLETFQGHKFPQLVRKYREEVNSDMELIMITIGEGCWSMYRDMAEEAVKHQRIHVDAQRPDLSKFDPLIGRIALLSKSSVQGDLKTVQREWKAIQEFSYQLFEELERVGPRVENPYVRNLFPDQDSLYGKINGQLLGLQTHCGKSYAMNKSLLKKMVEDRSFFQESLGVVLDFLEQWQGEEAG